MANAFVAAFEILSFGAIIVLIVLGLGIIASMMGIFNFAQGEFVLLGAYITYLAYATGLPIWAGMVAAPFVVGALGFVLEALIIRRFYAAPIVAMLGTYALGLIIREIVRGLIGGFYLIGAGADRRLDRHRHHALLGVALHHHRHHAAGDGRLLSAAVAHQLRPARARARWRTRRWRGRRGISTPLIYGATFAFGAALAGLAGALIVPLYQPLRRSRHPLPGPGLPRGHGRRRRHLRWARCWVPALVGTLSAALPWVMAPVVADVLVFVLAIAFIKFRPQGLIAGQGV